MTLLVSTTIHICTCSQLHTCRGTPNSYHYIPFLLQKTHCWLNPWHFLLLTCMMFFQCLGTHMYVYATIPFMVLSRTIFRKLWFWCLKIITLSTTSWMHNDQLGWDGPLFASPDYLVSKAGSILYFFILTLLIQQGTCLPLYKVFLWV